MREIEGDIWDFHPACWVVVPTNIGWKSDGSNVMGAGMAKAAQERFPGLARWYGDWCKSLQDITPVVLSQEHRLIMFPVKPLNPRRPHLSWQSDASLPLIERSAGQLACAEVEGDVFLPLVGCGAGRLSESQVLPVLRNHLVDDRFVLVRQKVKGTAEIDVKLL